MIINSHRLIKLYLWGWEASIFSGSSWLPGLLKVRQGHVSINVELPQWGYSDSRTQLFWFTLPPHSAPMKARPVSFWKSRFFFPLNLEWPTGCTVVSSRLVYNCTFKMWSKMFKIAHFRSCKWTLRLDSAIVKMMSMRLVWSILRHSPDVQPLFPLRLSK